MNNLPASKGCPTTRPCRVVFLDADTLSCGLPFPPELLGQLNYQSYGRTAPDEIAGRMRDADILITNKARLTAERLQGAPNLKRILVAAAGTDNVDLSAAQALGIRVHNVPDYCTESVAEHTLASLLALRRHLLTHARAATDGRWSASPFFCWHGPRIREVRGSVLGIVGRGRIGRATALLAQGLGARVIFAERPGRPAAADELPLAEVLAEADAISLHLPLTPDTRDLMNAQHLSLMKADSVLINTGRGAVVNAQALADALRAGRLAGAAIDVLDVEPPPPNHPLLAQDIPHLLLTPHVAWASEAAQQRLAKALVTLVAEHLQALA